MDMKSYGRNATVGTVPWESRVNRMVLHKRVKIDSAQERLLFPKESLNG